MKKEMINKEKWIMHRKMMGIKMILLGILVLVNFYFIGISWPIFAGAILVGAGVGSLAKFCCCKHRRR